MDQQALTMKHTLAFEAFDDELVEGDEDEEESFKESFEEVLFNPDVVILGTSVWNKYVFHYWLQYSKQRLSEKYFLKKFNKQCLSWIKYLKSFWVKFKLRQIFDSLLSFNSRGVRDIV